MEKKYSSIPSQGQCAYIHPKAAITKFSKDISYKANM